MTTKNKAAKVEEGIDDDQHLNLLFAETAAEEPTDAIPLVD